MSDYDQMLKDSLALAVNTWRERNRLREELAQARRDFEAEMKPLADRLTELDAQCAMDEQMLRDTVVRFRQQTGEKNYLGVIQVRDTTRILEYDQSPSGEVAQWVRHAHPGWLAPDWKGIQSLPEDHPLIQHIHAEYPDLIVPDWKQVEQGIKASATKGYSNPAIQTEVVPTAALKMEKVMAELAMQYEVDQRQQEEKPSDA